MAQHEHTDSAMSCQSNRWLSPIVWLSVLAAGWTLFEVTQDPAIGAAAVCLKFASGDVRTAAWLLRSDPCRARGRALWWLSVAFGLLKAALAGLFVSCILLVTLVVIGFGPAAVQGLIPAALGVSVLIGGAMSLSFLAAGVAVELARLGRFRLWLDASGSRARRPGQWPPHGTGHAANNLLLAPLLVGGSAAMVVSWICLTNAMSCWLPVWGAGAVAALIVGVFALLYGLRCRPVIAATPLECWHRAEIAREC